MKLLLALALVVTSVSDHPKAMAKPSPYIYAPSNYYGWPTYGYAYGKRSADLKEDFRVIYWLHNNTKLSFEQIKNCFDCPSCYDYCDIEIKLIPGNTECRSC